MLISGNWYYDRDMPVAAWARAIARYKLIDIVRKTRAASSSISLERVHGIPVDESAAVDAALTAGKLLAALPDKMRVPIELVKLVGLSVKEAATATGSPEAAVKVNIHRGAKAMSRVLGGHTR